MTATTLVAAFGVLLSLPNRSMAMNPVFLETNMKAAWTTLLAEGDRHVGGVRGLLDVMLRDCHGRRSEAWGAECDRALYLEAALENAAQSSTAPKPTLSRVVEGEDRQRTVSRHPKAGDIAVAEPGRLPFSSFFLEYAVPKRPVILSRQRVDDAGELIFSSGITMGETGAKTTTDVTDEDHASGGKHQPQPAVSASSGDDQWIINGRLLDILTACVPYPAGGDSTAGGGTVERPLSLCKKSVLENLSVPLYVTGDFAQRFRRQGVLPPEDHPEVERFVSGWQSVHRTRRGSSTPAQTCPCGTNTILSVVSGTLEVLVYSADGLPHLQPVYGATPCSPLSSSTTVDGEKNALLGSIKERGRQASSAQTRDPGYIVESSEHEGEVFASMNEEALDTFLRATDKEVTGAKGRTAERAVEHSGAEQEEEMVPAEEEEVVRDKPVQEEGVENWPHEPKYCAKLWPVDEVDQDEESQTSRRNARDVTAGELLFVPSGGAVSWRAKGEEDEGVALRFCYVDASNFDSVKTQLPLYAAVEVGASGLLRAFRSPIFDTSMSRNPSEVFADEFFTGEPLHPAATSTSASTPTSPNLRIDGSVDGGDTETTRTQRRLSAEGGRWEGVSDSSSASLALSGSSSTSESSARKGGRARRGRKSFKEWQDDSRWDLKVLGLTLPTLEPPRAMDCGRTNCTVEWTSSFIKREQDQTSVGFNVSFLPATANASVAGNNDGGGYMELHIGDPRLKSEHALDRELLSLGITEGKRYTAVVDADLTPDTPYRFSVSVVYGETGGPFSELSKPARTAKITAPLPVPTAPEGSPGPHAVTLHFWSPHDDGGSLVRWYHVMSRPTGDHVLSKWQAVGMVEASKRRESVSVHDKRVGAVAVKVDNLVPGVAYQFRVCAQNDVGTSPWSAPSEPVVVRNAAAGDTGDSLGGFYSGHKHLRLPNVTEASVSYAGENEPPPGEGFDPFEREVHGPTVVLDDRAGSVSVNDSMGSIAVWACHFSPRSFKVKAEVVVSEPADASRELDNSRFARNRVVVVVRGNIPIVHKVLNAQRAGALGVIVADDGRCGSTFNQLCVYGSDPPEGWASLDLLRPWLEVHVPVVLMLQEDAARLMAEAGEAAEEVETMAWSSLYDGWHSSSSAGHTFD